MTFPIFVETSNLDKLRVTKTRLFHSGTGFPFDVIDPPSVSSMSCSTSLGTVSKLPNGSKINYDEKQREYKYRTM